MPPGECYCYSEQTHPQSFQIPVPTPVKLGIILILERPAGRQHLTTYNHLRTLS